MKLKHVLMLTGLMIVIAAALFIGLRPTPERQIRRHLNEMASLASFSATESALLSAIGKAGDLADHFTEDVAFDAPVVPFDVHRRNDIKTAFLRLYRLLQSLRITIHVIDIRRSGDDVISDIFVTAVADGETVKRDFLLRWARSEGRWRVYAVQELETISAERPLRVLPPDGR